jgi:hypothetical protein
LRERPCGDRGGGRAGRAQGVGLRVGTILPAGPAAEVGLAGEQQPLETLGAPEGVGRLEQAQ